MNLSTLLRRTRAQFSNAGIETSDLDARLIVEHFSHTTRNDAIVDPSRQIAPDALVAIDAAIARHVMGEPVHRILGYREFYGLKLNLSPDTLEPRPDTETLVEAALPHLRDMAARSGRCRILDLGTGTGAIALALLSQLPQATAIATDISADALATAARNARTLGLADRFEIRRSTWFQKIFGLYDAIVSNPPYIRRDDIPLLSTEVRNHDPLRALDGGKDGLEAYRAIAQGSVSHLAKGGIIIVEIGHDQRQDVTQLFAESGYAIESLHRDLGGNDRVIVFKRQE